MAKSEVKEVKKEVKKEKVKRPGMISRFNDFVRSVWKELKKVTWPTRQELIQHTSVVLGIVLIMTLIVWVIDTGLGGLLALIIG
ncbi:MAG: preprotein translocase subunit SecE [Eubacteriaceae bacterium]|nr:preprotein translocase subunit SecE [Eubacteriaceae bacterium]